MPPAGVRVSAAEPCIEIGTGTSTAGDSSAAGAEAARAAQAMLRRETSSVVLVYTSSRYDAAGVLAGVRSVFADAPICGVTTAGEVCNARATGSVVVVVLASPYLAVHCAVGRNVSANAEAALAEALDMPALRPFFSDSAAVKQRLAREGKSLFAMLFTPGNTKAHDSRGYELTELLKTRTLGAIPIFGGSAADDWHLEQNAVLLGSEVYRDSLLIVLVETKLQVGIAMAHGFRPTGRSTTVTDVSGQELLSLDGRPAAEVVPRLFDSTRAALAGRHATLTTGKAVGIRDAMGEFGLTVCTFPTERHGVRTVQPFTPGTVFTVMEPDPSRMMDAGAKALREASLRGSITSPAVALVSYCALRAQLVGDDGAAREIAVMTDVMAGAPLVGFCSFGEAGTGADGHSRHANASVAVLVIGKELSETARVALEAEHLRAELQAKADELERQVQARTRQLALAEELLRDAVESISEGFAIYDAEDRLVMCNQRYKDLYAHAAAAMVPGAAFADILCAALASGQVPDAVGREPEWLAERLRQHRTGQSYEHRLIDGRWLLSIERPTGHGGVACMRIDITALKAAQAEADAARSRMLDFASVATDWFWESDIAGNITYLSEPFEAATGVAVAARLGGPRFDLNRAHDPANPAWEGHFAANAAHQPFRDFVMTVRVPRGTKHLSISGKPMFDADGVFQGYRGTTSDVTAVVEAQRALARQKEELAATAAKLEAASAAKSLFLANMSHELRTPLNAVLGFSEIVQDARMGPLDARYREYGRDIHNAGSYLLRLINDVLDASKMEAGALELEEEFFDLVELIVECRRLIAEKAASGGVELLLEASALPPLLADRLRIKQVVLNLLSNAVKFTPKGGRVRLSAVRAGDGGLLLTVADNGIGMAPEQVPLALEPFRQLEQSLARRYEGSGLGLPLAKGFVEMHGGTIGIETSEGAGTTVRVWLPPHRFFASSDLSTQTNALP